MNLSFANPRSTSSVSALTGWLLAVSLWVLAGCSSTPTSPVHVSRGHTESGIASYYGNEFQSRKTANGERFDQRKLTAAHRTMPFGTRVKVTNTRNGRTVVVRINDRGPFAKGRIIDLSSTAFKTIGNLNAGVLPVRIEVLN